MDPSKKPGEAAEPRLEAHITRDRAWFHRALDLRRRIDGADATDAMDTALPSCALDDHFDPYCEHLLVHDAGTDRPVGACRILAPEAARRAGGYEAEFAFDLELLGVLRDRLVEVGRTCIDPAYPADAVMTSLVSRLARYLIDNGHDYVIGAVQLDLADGGRHAASVHRAAWEQAASPEDYRVYPFRRLDVEGLAGAGALSAPPALRAYLDAGAWISGEPGIDGEGGIAMVPFLLPLARMRDHFARQFLARAA